MVDCFSGVVGAPIRRGGASLLRVATGGNASSGSKLVAAARPPRRIGRRGWGFAMAG